MGPEKTGLHPADEPQDVDNPQAVKLPEVLLAFENALLFGTLLQALLNAAGHP